MRRKAYSRGERKSQIADVFLNRIQQGRDNRLTMYEVAEILDLAPSTKLQKIMLEMVEEDTLSFVTENKGNTWKRVFSLKHVQHRIRNIRINGEQLAMEL